MSHTPPSLDRQCPSCFKRFASDSSVLRHMNSPHTSCMDSFSWFQSVSPPGRRSPPDELNRDNLSLDDDSACNNEPTVDPILTQHEDIHPNPPYILGTGPGFMDGFHSDRLAEQRKANIYFPFSSKEEWGFASWLSRSGLSMRAIDDLLVLPIVRLSGITLSSFTDPSSRSNSCHFPSQL